MKKLILILVLLVPFSFATFAQVDYSDAQMFGSSRDVAAQNSYDFGTITTDIVKHGFLVKNSYKVPVTIKNVKIPQGMGVVIIDEEIPAESVGEILVIVDKNNMKKSSFNEEIIVTTEYKLFETTKTSKQTFTVKGNF